MTQTLHLTGLGMAASLAQNVVGGVSNTQTATGSSSQTNSFAIVSDITIFTTAAGNTGARLPAGSSPGDSFVISNLDSNTMLIYPPTGGVINGGSVNASANLTTKKSVICFSIDGTNYLANFSA